MSEGKEIPIGLMGEWNNWKDGHKWSPQTHHSIIPISRWGGSKLMDRKTLILSASEVLNCLNLDKVFQAGGDRERKEGRREGKPGRNGRWPA